MRKIMTGILAATLLATSAHAQMGGGMGGMGGGGMGGDGMGGPGGGGGGRGGPPEGGEAPSGPRGGAPKMMKPIARKQFDEAVIAMFRLVDTNKDGIVTLAEFEGVVNARRMAVIHNRFARVDANHDGRIDEAEFAAWQSAKGSAAQMEQSFDAVGEIIPDSVGPVLGDKERDMALAMAIEPFNAVVIAKANLNYDTGVSVEELLAYEGARFDKADANHDTYLVREELDALRGGPAGGPMGGRGPDGRGPDGKGPEGRAGGPPPQG